MLSPLNTLQMAYDKWWFAKTAYIICKIVSYMFSVFGIMPAVCPLKLWICRNMYSIYVSTVVIFEGFNLWSKSINNSFYICNSELERMGWLWSTSRDIQTVNIEKTDMVYILNYYKNFMNILKFFFDKIYGGMKVL